MVGIIITVQEEMPWMVGPSTQITKGILSFPVKACWTLVHHKLSPIKRDNMLSPDRATLVKGIMDGYEIDITKIIPRYFHDREVSTDTTLAFPYLLTQICPKEGVSEISGVEQYLMVWKTINLCLIKDVTNPVSKAKVGGYTTSDSFQNGGK